MTVVHEEPSSREELSSRFDDSNIFELPAGHVIVAGEYMEPMQQIDTCLVDYVSPGLLEAPDAAEQLVSWARHEFPQCRMMLARMPERHAQLPGFEDYLYYILLTKAPTAHADETTIQVRQTKPGDLEFVSELLVEAFDDGLEMRVDKAPEGAAAAQAKAILANPQARSFVASYEGEDIGHATLLVDQKDDVSGLEFVELLDFLVERKHPMRYSAESALVTASWRFAQTLSKPLLGHIVVREKTCHCAGVELTILDRVTVRGWTFHHKYQRIMLGDA